nr:hypothetical protein [Dehalococcoidales bacterium]
YWAGADEHVRRLEDRIGQVKHVYVEMIDRGGEEGAHLTEQISPGAGKLVASRLKQGATFEALEDPETLAETMDWERCLLGGLASRKAADYVSQAYSDASRRRYEFIAKRFEESLQEGEAGLAILTEHHRVQFPPSIRVFYVAPPALDEVHRWLRDYREQARAPKAEATTEPEEEQPEGGAEPGKEESAEQGEETKQEE